MVMMIFKQKTKKNNMKKLIAILMLAVTVTACSWPTIETPTTEPTTESVDSLYQDTVDLGGSVDTTAAVAQ
jgi:PBP1b-binding outer membrane lipoprotein LpoB